MGPGKPTALGHVMVVGERKEDTERKKLDEGVECSRTANGIGHARAGDVRISLGKVKDLDEAEAKARRNKRWSELLENVWASTPGTVAVFIRVDAILNHLPRSQVRASGPMLSRNVSCARLRAQFA